MIDDPKEILGNYWGFSSFIGSQEKIITRILNGKDVLALLPTGGGKSVCYQIPAMAKEGICIVVSPLIALIQNQVDDLKKKNIKAIALSGGIPFNEVNKLLDNCLYGNYKFLYLSPERLQQDLVQDRLAQMNINLIAIDEAHCISQWGNDFRPAYLHCSILRELAPKAPVIALTATATQQVAEEIVVNLKMQQPLTVKDSFSRKNIVYEVLFHEDKQYVLREMCSKIQKSIIVYVQTRRLSQEIARFLVSHSFKTAYFHGGLSNLDKKEALNKWLENKVQIMVATNAFGMGIDKPNVGLVVHYQIPDSLENYFQEAGRAGRDGLPAKAVILTNKTDGNRAKKQFLSVLPDVAFVKLLYNKLNNYFQIPYGEGAGETFQFRFNEFCEIYKLNSILAYNALRILDQNSAIALTASFSKKTKVRFVASKKQLFVYLDENPTKSPIIQMVLRTYGGIFDYDTKVNTFLLSKKLSLSENKIVTVLEQLQKDGIIAYTAQNTDLEITFLVPREDDRTINIFAKRIEGQQQVKINTLESMLAYLANDRVCRSRQLLHYFGETQQRDCGKCDVCMGREKMDRAVTNRLQQEILALLNGQSHTSRTLIQLLDYKESFILEMLQQLLADEKININNKNEYQLN